MLISSFLNDNIGITCDQNNNWQTWVVIFIDTLQFLIILSTGIAMYRHEKRTRNNNDQNVVSSMISESDNRHLVQIKQLIWFYGVSTVVDWIIIVG